MGMMPISKELEVLPRSRYVDLVTVIDLRSHISTLEFKGKILARLYHGLSKNHLNFLENSNLQIPKNILQNPYSETLSSDLSFFREWGSTILPLPVEQILSQEESPNGFVLLHKSEHDLRELSMF